MSRARWVAKELGPPLAGVAGLIVVWALVAAATSSTAIPSPAEVWNAFVAGMRDGTIPEAAVKTLIRLAFSFAVSIVIGTAIGIGLALNEFARRSIRPLVVALQITPFIAWLPLAVVWFGATERAVVFVTIVGAFPSMTLATMSAMRPGAAAVPTGRPHARRRGVDALPGGDLPGGAPRLHDRARSRPGGSRGRR